MDYRKLNAVTKKDVFPLPRIDDALDLLANSKYFSTLDLASGYWQVTMNSDSQEKTAFTKHRGFFEFFCYAVWVVQRPGNVPAANGTSSGWSDWTKLHGLPG